MLKKDTFRTWLLPAVASLLVALDNNLLLANDDSVLITETPLELSIHLHHRRHRGYDTTWPVEIAACKLTNICLRDATAGLDNINSGEALNLILSSGKIPDIVGSSRLKDVANQFGLRGAFMPLNKLIDEHAPYLKVFFEKHPDILAAITAPDGNIYYIPTLPDGKFARAYWIRTDWLEALDLEIPTTVEEFEKVLVAFRDNDPNGNGLKDEIPFFARHWQEFIRLVTLFGGRSTGTDQYHDFIVSDDIIMHPYAQEGYREGIRHLARWYREGLVDAEIFTRGSDARQELLSANLGGSTHDWFASTATYNDLANDIDGFEFKVIAPPANVNGIQFEENSRMPVKADGWAMGGQNTSPVETIKYFDFWFSPVGRRLANFGIEGEQYELIDGQPVFLPEFLANGPVNDQLYDIGAQITTRGFHQDFRYEEQWLNEFALEGIALYEEGNFLIDHFLGVFFNKDEQFVYDKYWPVLRTYMLDKQRAWISGENDVESDWDNYQAELKNKRLDLVIDALQDAYDRQRES